MNHWLRTDEYEEVASSLEFLAYCSSKLESDVYYWKWVIISLHSGLQGFMVIALRDSAGLNILKDSIAAEWLRAYREGGDFPIEYLDTFLNLYKKIKSNQMLKYVHSKRFVPERSQGKSIKRINWFRNKFTHFIPQGWSIEVSGLPQICLDCIKIIRFLGWSSGNVMWREHDIKNRCERALAQIEKKLNSMKTIYERSTA